MISESFYEDITAIREALQKQAELMDQQTKIFFAFYELQASKAQPPTPSPAATVNVGISQIDELLKKQRGQVGHGL